MLAVVGSGLVVSVAFLAAMPFAIFATMHMAFIFGGPHCDENPLIRVMPFAPMILGVLFLAALNIYLTWDDDAAPK